MSFRAGVVSALVVGLITSLGLVIVLALLFGTIIVTSTSLQISETSRGADQLSSGVDPSEISLVMGTDDLDDSFWVVMQDGEVVASDGPVVPGAFEAPFDGGGTIEIDIDISDRPNQVSGFKLLDGRDWYIIQESVSTDEANYEFLSANSSISGDLGSFYSDSLYFAVPFVLFVMTATGAVSSRFSRSALRPVENMRREVEQITQQSLDRRVPTTGARDVIDKLADTMNEMLGRLESSTMQQSQFLADASHELRSPVAGVLAQLDVAVAYPDRVDNEVLLPKLKAEAERLQLLVDDLLFLSRSESRLTHRPAPTGSSVAVDELFETEIDHQRTLHPDVSIMSTGTTGVLVAGLDRDIARALRNLTNNAMRHATSSVELGVEVVGEMASITIRDDGEGIDPEDATRIFDRFVRLDEARTRDHGGSGLGLAIVHEIVRRHGGAVSVVDGGEGATFQVLLPLAAEG